ncbi:MAG TPA: FGGY family carbohydrate kinase, partial [Candidatus Sulfotelmatobacter sp.]|nr:FGGY family carbohydrate kinase [Candidatus Sulfotelmatobacter sp.]
MVAAVVGLDVGTSAVRAVMLDDTGAFVTREVQRLPAGRRTDDGGHLLDEAAILAAAEETLENVCFRGRVRAAAVAVSATAGTLCFRDENNQAVGEAVAYDDLRHGDGLARVAAWLRELPAARRVIPLADAVLERFGAEPGGTDWTNARALGW